MKPDIEEMSRSKSGGLVPPENFDFPFPPYPIQHEFMSMLYSTIEEGKLGIFESPTGTGKSLSIICGALCWLRDHIAREKDLLKEGIEDLKKQEEELEKENDWISGQSRKLELERSRLQLQSTLKLMTDQDEEIQQMKERISKQVTKEHILKEDNKPKKSKDEDSTDILDDEDLLLEEVDLKEIKDYDSAEEEKEEEKYQGVQIIICSRTHSQLSQLVGEVIRSPYSDVRLVPLASRQSYCVNSAVRKLNSLALINEKCSDLLRGSKGHKTKVEEGLTTKKSKVASGCLFLRSSQAVNRLTEEALVKVQDVEALVEKGKKHSACPYYATRSAVPMAQVLVVPYNTLLHKETREACGLRLRGSVVIIDEAHNLLDAISQVYSAQLTGQQLTHAYSQLVQYRDKYSKRFSATNLMYLEQLIFVTARLIRMLGGKAGCPPNEGTGKVIDTKLFSLGLFLTEAQIDNINQFRLIEFANRSKLSHKLHGFSERYQPTVNITPKAAPESGIRAFLKEISAKKNTPEPVAETPAEPEERVSNNPILPVLAFLQALTSSCSDGRVVCSTQSTVGRGSLKFLLLNPAAHFTDIVSQSRSVVVCGGTMQPISEFKDQLFAAAGADTTRVTQFSCGHVIPPEHILPIVLTSGPTNKPFDFSYQNRNSVAIMTELGRTLDNFCNIVPGGIVCFFCSYDYEQAVFEHFKKSGTIDKLSLKKKIFREPRKSSQVDQVLSDYAAAVKAGKKNPAIKPNGALLFSVVGGKLSEGLNFSDDLGRCVIVVGMPYPNIKSPELQEKMAYLDSTLGGGAGQSHYENLCMKAVNQCIGRAVRHREDYATVLLLDARYARPNTLKLLPGWIQTSLQTNQKMGPTVAAVAKFFAAKRAKNASQ
ncbi:ATP-dependent DNA helicase DDX11 [Macrosteles quadrilineatus]|uniref:ATP-dependent DNA helicase DDX11 n=1 Tax=Macrosteles quadrilineatus TaxID=74068 RepID=UPI0023E1E7D1|nr:ATP-dependent DNA helicase DDX11 [Macrosteles quadrilineatus]